MTRFVVIGGGVSGLAAAHRLAELRRGQPNPVQITLLEASSRFGGLIETRQEGQFLLELGPDAFLCGEPSVTDLCRRLGIQEEMIETDEKFRRSFVLTGGELTLKAGPSQWPEMERWYAGGSRYSQMFSFKGGVEHLIQTLSRKMPEAELRLSCPVARIEKGMRWAVILQNGETLQADAVCIAIPAGKAAALLHPFAPELAAELNAIPYDSVATLNAVFRRSDVAHPLDAFGFVVPPSERRRILGATFASVKFPGRAAPETVLIRAFVGGTSRQDLVDLDDSGMKQMVIEELRRILGIRGEPILTVIRRHLQAIPQYRADHPEKVAAVEKQAARYPGLYLIGNAYHGVGIPDCIRQAEMAAEQMAA